jgi:hypothetical protein
LYGLSRPVSLSDLARLIEERLDLQARLSTALEYYDRQDRSPFASPADDLVEEVVRTVRETMDLKALT